ncbi:hypothetical protein V5F38_08350 [Xanthobacter sp. V0B-10]|uniref:hypothetical protein n=2 Tax=Xanthobacter albus TaxID=3119929 RepID=UPI003727C724
MIRSIGYLTNLMKRMLPACAMLVMMGSAQSQAEAGATGMIVCNQPYALCTSAPCVPMPGDPAKAVCNCTVENGPSLGTQACPTLAPSTDARGVRTIYSTFSFKQFEAGKKVLTCPGGTPWTLCLNKVCTVDPADPGKAVCTCDVKTDTAAWVTLGGGCDGGTCKDRYWSGASVELLNDASAVLAKAVKLAKAPVNWCPVGK